MPRFQSPLLLSRSNNTNPLPLPGNWDQSFKPIDEPFFLFACWFKGVRSSKWPVAILASSSVGPLLCTVVETSPLDSKISR